ncbi:MAG TPA: hypothetical protein VHX52_11510 [Steroidobacteraceae bacterium]|jgi:predicted secreted protein|nr:hypothetical protein [Steroidobacteraceae bacterium]
MDHLLLELQNSPFAFWLSQGAFPPIITVHSAGMAMLVGLQGIINLRVLGIGRGGLPIPAMRRFMKVVWVGFWMNLVSGVLLFSIYPDKYVHNTLFRFKLSFIVAGLVIGALLNSSLLSVGDEYAATGASAPARAKVLAVLSLACWISAIVAGRYLAYSTFADVGAGTG